MHHLILASQLGGLKPPTAHQETTLTERGVTRLYIPQGLAAGAMVELDAAQAHRLRHVLRLGPGAAIAAFNATGGEWIGRLAELGRGRVSLHIERCRRPAEMENDLWLLFAPLKRARLDWLVEKATELGVAALVPVWTERTQPERINRERLYAIAVAAAEQSERLSVPDVAAPERLDRLVVAWPADRTLIVCDESGGGVPIAAALAALPAGTPAAVLIGPEGGFAEAELDALGKLPIVNRVGLGPRVLRAETAALAALAVYQAIAGDWRSSRRR
jgi:16S rRNA (uracil1498-N3)-methyltransferase